MQEARGVFNPCEYHSLFYLCGFGSLLIESFSPLSRLFSAVDLTLPEAHCCLLYVQNDVLLVYTTTYMLRFSLNSRETLIELSPRVIYREEIKRVQNSQPVIDPVQQVIYTVCSGKCYSFRLTNRYKGPVWDLD